MKKILSALLALALTQGVVAQAIKYRNFDIDSKRPITELTEAEKKEPVVVVKETKSIEMIEGKDGNLEAYLFFHKVVQINSEDKLQSFNKIYLPVSSPDALLTLKARTINKSGKSYELFKGDMKQIKEDDGNYLILALDGLEKGSEIEYYFLIQFNYTSFYTQRIDNRYFTRDYMFEFISPEKLVYESKSYNGLPQMTDTLLTEKNFKTVAVKNLEAMEDERYAANDALVMRAELKLSQNLYTGSHSKVMTFTDAAKRYYKNLHDVDKEEKKAIEKIYDKLKLSKVSDQGEKIRTIENYFKTNYNIINTADVSLSDALKNNFLTKFQAAKMYVYMFEKENIDYELVLTTEKDEAEFDPEFETWNYLNELFFYFPGTKKYMSPDIIVYRYGMISPACMGQKGLFIKTLSIGETKSALNSVKFIEPANFEGNFDNIDAEISFTSAMDLANIKLTRSLGGYSATGLRPVYYYVNDEKKKEVIEEHLQLGIKDAVVKNTNVSNADINTDEVNKPFIAKGDVEVASLLETAGDNYLFKVGSCIGPQAELYQERPRKFPAYMTYPHSFVRKIVITIPEGYEAKGLNELNMDITLNDNAEKAAGFVSTYTLTGNQLVINVNEYYNKQYYALPQFNDFRKVINAAADFNKLTIVFSKKK